MTKYNVIVECPEGNRLVADTRGAYGERRWIPATMRTVDTLEEAQGIARDLEAHPHPQQRGVWIEHR